jgi:hypothetical protein
LFFLKNCYIPFGNVIENDYLCSGSKNKSVSKYGGDPTQAESPAGRSFLYKKQASHLRLTFHFSLASVTVFQ